MKKILLLLLVLLALPISGRTDDFLDSTGEMFLMIRNNLRMQGSSSGLTDSVMKKYVIQACYDLMLAASPIARRDTIFTSQYVEDYTIDSQIVEIRKVYWVKKDSIVPLRYAPVEVWDSLAPYAYTTTSKENLAALPQYYDWTYGRITLYPSPSKVDTIVIDGIARPDSIFVASDTATFVMDFPVFYRPMLVTYATVLTAAHLKEWQAVEFWWKIFEFQASTFNVTVNVGIRPKEEK